MQPTEQPIITSGTAETATPTNSDAFPNSSSPRESQKPSRQKVVTIILAVTSIIFLIATVALLCLYLLRQPSNESSNMTTPTDIVNRAETDAPNEEIDITDESVLRDLDEKIAILHNTDQTGNYNKKHLGVYFNVIGMYASGYLEPVGARVMHIIDYLGDSYMRTLTTEEIGAAWGEEDITSQYESDFKRALVNGIDGAIVAEKYKDVFGKNLYEEEYSPDGACFFYHYNQEFDYFYRDPLGGCGGSSPLYSHHYNTKYTASGDYAYVYISGALEAGDSGNVYCGIYALDQLYNRAPLCDYAGEDDPFVLNDTNYEKYTLYRFVFKKADDGTYYFVKVEPANNE